MVSTVALPRDFDARYGAGLQRTLVLGGGGVWFISWLTGYLQRLSDAGVELTTADRCVGTSAGSVVSSILVGRRLKAFHGTVRRLAGMPRLISAIAPSGDLHPSQLRALDAFRDATDAEPETIRAIGFAALSAQSPHRTSVLRAMTLLLGIRSWPSPTVHVSCVDAYTGERCIVTAASRVPIARTVAASSAVPGIFAPQQVQDRRCMDGGVSGTALHLDVVAGSRRALVLALTEGRDDETWGTIAPGGIEAEIDALRASGTEVLVRTPAGAIPEDLMDPALAIDALRRGTAQADADLPLVREFWGA